MSHLNTIISLIVENLIDVDFKVINFLQSRNVTSKRYVMTLTKGDSNMDITIHPYMSTEELTYFVGQVKSFSLVTKHINVDVSNPFNYDSTEIYTAIDILLSQRTPTYNASISFTNVDKFIVQDSIDNRKCVVGNSTNFYKLINKLVYGE